MAIIFISPKKKQKIFIWLISIALILFLVTILFIIFSPGFKNETASIPIQDVLYNPSARINFDIMDSSLVKNLDLFEGMQTEFDYAAQDQNGNNAGGKVLALNQEDAKSILEKMGLKVLTLKESNIGRSDPFVPYYQATVKNIAPKK